MPITLMIILLNLTLNKNVSYGSAVNNAHFCKESKKWIIEYGKVRNTHLQYVADFFTIKVKVIYPH